MGIIVQDDWDVSNVICNFLEFFYTTTKKCLGVYYLTTQLVITHIYNIANNFREHRKNPIFTNTCAVMKIKILKY